MACIHTISSFFVFLWRIWLIPLEDDGHYGYITNLKNEILAVYVGCGTNRGLCMDRDAVNRVIV
jgi:hypothetical protein